MLGKVYLVLEFDNEAQKAAVQEAFKEISNMRSITGRQIEQAYPYFRQNRAELAELFTMIRERGVKAVLSVRGAQIVSKLTRK